MKCSTYIWRPAVNGLCLCLLLYVPSAAADASTPKAPPIMVPDGFAVERVAAPPLVRYPMLGTFDDAGRLFVCESAGLNLDAEQLLKRLPNFVRMLEDTDSDGQFDRSTIFADRMTLPSGATWHDGALYVASPPSIWRLEDTDGDGVADRRDELITGFNFRGHAGDIHGPHLGPDGRLYFLDGTMGHEVRDKDGRLVSKGSAARIFSIRPDGSDLETFCGGGMSNPVAATFTEEGELFSATTFFNYKSRDRIRHDALFHAVYGGVYPKHRAYLQNEFKLTGPLLPALSRFGMSAPSNLHCYRSDAFGAEYRGDIFISHFNTRSITRTKLRRAGSTFRAENSSFLTSESPDFHPCAIIEDSDGSLLVIDTGGWFKIGCPTSSEQPQILGGIYRVQRNDRKSSPDPRGLKIDWQADSDRLVGLLDDDRFVVRDRVVAVLAARGDAAVEALQGVLESSLFRARRSAVWALTRIGTPAALAAARSAMSDSEAGIRLVACRCAATHRDAEAVGGLLKLVFDMERSVRRQAAAALGRIGDPVAIPALLAASRDAGDRMLEHAFTYALIEISDREATLEGLQHPSANARRTALTALDQMDDGNLNRELIASVVKTDDEALLEAIVSVVARHPQWIDLVGDVIKNWLRRPEMSEVRRRSLQQSLYAMRRESECQSIMADALANPGTSTDARLLLMDVMLDSGFREFPDIWEEQLIATLRSGNHQVAAKSLIAMASTTSGQFDEGVSQYAQDDSQPVPLRVRAISLLSRNSRSLAKPTFDFLVGQCGTDADFESRVEAARALGNAKLTPAQRGALIDVVANAGPLELPLLLKGFQDARENGFDTAGPSLIAAIGKAPGFASLNDEQLAALFEKAPDEFRPSAELLFQRLADEQKTSLRTVLKTVFNQAGGDPVRGREVFFSKRALCSECHRTGPEKGKGIGPDLRRIGEVRSHRDLIEAILNPNASFARGFEPKTIVMKSGKVFSGVIRGETNDTLTLYTSQREEIRVARIDVERIVNSKASIMPHGLERSLTQNDLRDLLAYLSSLKRPASIGR